MKKKNIFFRGCLLFIMAASIIWIGCPDPANPGVPGGITGEKEEPDLTSLGGPSPSIIPGDGKLTVSWNAVEGAAKYEVSIRDDDTELDEAKTTIVNQTSVVINDLLNGTKYWVMVRAGNSKGWTSYGLELSGTPAPDDIPFANRTVENLRVTEEGNNSLTLAWSPVPDAISYKVEWFANGASIGSLDVIVGELADSNNPACAITGLSNGVEYTVEVSATDGEDFTAAASTTGTPVAQASAPLAPVIAEITDGAKLGTFVIKWYLSATATDYQVRYSKSDTPPAQLAADVDGIGNALTYSVDNGGHSTKYYIWVAAKNDIGWSPWSAVEEFTTRDPLVPAVPTGLIASPANTSVTLAWAVAANADKYEAAYSDDDFVTQTVQTSDNEGCQITGLTNDKVYKFKVRAGSADAAYGETKTVGWSEWCTPIEETPKQWTSAPDAPTNVTVEPSGRKQLNVQWTSPGGADYFKVMYGESSDFDDAVLWKNGQSESWTNPPVLITGLKDSVKYYVWVAAGNTFGYGNKSDPGSGATLTPVTPAVPANLTVTPAQLHHLTVSWDAVGNATKYQLEIKGGADDETITLTETSRSASGLVTGAAYTFRVRAGADEFSAWSSPVTGTPIVPKPVSLNVAHNNASKQLTAAWALVSGADSYNVRHSATDNVDGAAVSGNPATSPFDIVGLEPQTLYYVWVRAQEGSGGNAQYSEWIKGSATTKEPDLPADVKDITLTPGDGNIAVNWSAVSGAAGYEVNYGATGNWTTTAAPTSTTYTISGLTNYTEYNVRVRAKNSDGPSVNWSPVKTAIPKLPLPPAPTGLTLDNSIRCGLKVSWDAVTQPGTTSTPVINYKVTYGKTDVEADATLYGDNIPTTSAQLSDLDGDTLYYVWVSAGNQTGFGPSVRKSATVADVPPPIEAGAPNAEVSLGGLAAYEVGGTAHDGADYGNTTLHTWLGQPNSNDAFPAGKDKDLLSGVVMANWNMIEGATSYDVYVATSNTQTAPARPAAPTANTSRLSYFHRDCDPDLYYFIWVAAKNNKGSGPIGKPYSGRVRGSLSLVNSKQIQTSGISYNMIERADYPKKLTATVTGEGSVRLSWDKSDRAAWYEVYYGVNGSDVRPMTGGSQNREMHGEMWTEGNTQQGNRRQVPYRWLPPLTDESGALATPWNDKTGEAGIPGQIFKVHSLETTITGLDPNTRYFFVVRSLNHNGERGIARIPNGGETTGAMSEGTGMFPSLTGGGAGLAAPTGIQVNPISPGGGGMLRVDWNTVAGANGYRVYYSKYPTPALTLPFNAVPNGSTTTTTLMRLDENYRYYVWVVATGADNAISPFSEMATGVPNYKDGTEPSSVDKTAIWGAPLKNSLYIEVNDDDPRVALGYVLEQSGEQFFDNVVLFASNFRVRNCATEGSNNHRCTKNGPHLHHNGNVQHILTNRDKYIKPLQDAGIKVLLGTLGDHDHFIYHSLGPWPFESAYPWATANNPGVAFHSNWWTGPASEYPLGNETVINNFINDLCSEIEKYGLDGFDMDDEWTSTQWSTGGANQKGTSTNPNIYGSSTVIRQQVAQNIANFIYRCRVRLDANTPEGVPKKIISVYDYGVVANYLGTSDATFGQPGGLSMEIKPNIWNYADYSLQPYYGSNSFSGIAGISKTKYGPAANGFHNNRTASRSGYDAANSYGYVCWYALTSIASRGGDNTQQMKQINTWSQHCFGQNVIYVGPDYPQDWIKW